MTSKKLAAIVGGLCKECLWRGWNFAMIGMKKLQDIATGYSAGGRFVLSSNGNARVLLTFKNFWHSRRHKIQFNT